MFVKWCCLMWLSYVSLQNIVSEYHQTDYDVNLKIVEIINVNYSYARDVKFGLQWINRTTRVINGNWTFLKTIGVKARLHVQILKFMSNEYRFFPVTLNLELCDKVPKNIFGLNIFFAKYSNFPSNCPAKRGFYYIHNGIFDYSQFPPYMPSGGYKMEGKMYNGEDYVWEINMYASVRDNRKLWK